MRRARALEVMLSADDYDAELAERYGWINSSVARPPARRFRQVARSSDRLFGEGVRKPEAQSRIQAAIKRGFQTPDAEMSLGRLLGNLADR